MLDLLHGAIIAAAMARTDATPEGASASSVSSEHAVPPGASQAGPAAPPASTAPAAVTPAAGSPAEPAAEPAAEVPAEPVPVTTPAADPVAAPLAHDPTCSVVLSSATSGAGHVCSADLDVTTGSSGDVTTVAAGGSSGDADALVPVHDATQPVSASAGGGDGGAAVVQAVSGSTGSATSAAHCAISFTAVRVVINGDLVLTCYAVAEAHSGSSGAVNASSVGGSGGDALSGVFGAPVAGVVLLDPTMAVAAAATAGAGGTASVSGASGATGSATATASCSFILVFAQVVINGQLRLVCLPVATATSGQSGVVTVQAVGGSNGLAQTGSGLAVGGSIVAVDPAAPRDRFTATTFTTGIGGATGAAHAGTSCSAVMSFTDVIVTGGVLAPCGLGQRSAQAGTAGAVTVLGDAEDGWFAPASSGTTLVGGAAVVLAATTGAGGSATAAPSSGSTGRADALATCLLDIQATDLTHEGALPLSCSAVATTRTGSSGTVTATALGGSAGTARAGLVLVGVTVDPPASDGGLAAPLGAGSPTALASDGVVWDLGPGLTLASSSSPGSIASVRVQRAAPAPHRAVPASLVRVVPTELAYTGVPVAALGGVGGAAVLAGAAMLVLAGPRRRRPVVAGSSAAAL